MDPDDDSLPPSVPGGFSFGRNSSGPASPHKNYPRGPSPTSSKRSPKHSPKQPRPRQPTPPPEERPPSYSDEFKESFHLAYLTSTPLIRKTFVDHEMRHLAMEKLDVKAERELLSTALSDSGRAVKIRCETATSDNLLKVVIQGCRALHYSGHGLPRCLAFEDNDGAMHQMDTEYLNKCVTAAAGTHGKHGKSNLQFVCVSACCSQEAGMAFANAGVPHVVAIQFNAQVSDTASKIFFRTFYTSLLCGGTVRGAYENGKVAVETSADVRRSDEANKFLLLPANKDHDVPIFVGIDHGKWEDITPDGPVKLIPGIPENFLGRERETQAVFATLRKHHLVTIFGAKGIGKTALAINVAHYTHERGRDWSLEGIFYFGLADKHLDPSKPKSLGYICSGVMGTKHIVECATNDAFVREIGEKRYLLILDGVDAFDGIVAPSELNVTQFLRNLFMYCPNVKVLVASERALESRPNAVRLQNVAEKVLELSNLKPLSAAKLFNHRAPRKLFVSEIVGGQHPPGVDAMDVLANHEVLRYLNGNPERICDAVKYLKDLSLDNLLTKLQDVYPTEPDNFEQWPFDDFWKYLAPGEEYVPVPIFETAIDKYIVNELDRNLRDTDIHNILGKVRIERFERDFIHRESVRDIWDWTNQLQEMLQRVTPLWNAQNPKLIQGILSTREVYACLNGCEPGTFLVRVSANNPGNLVVGYLDDHSNVIQSLVKVEESGFRIKVDAGEEYEYGTFEELILKLHPVTQLYVTPHDCRPKQELFDNEEAPH